VSGILVETLNNFFHGHFFRSANIMALFPKDCL
jgi:hypothetical protein